jgi:hypothetical protein
MGEATQHGGNSGRDSRYAVIPVRPLSCNSTTEVQYFPGTDSFKGTETVAMHMNQSYSTKCKKWTQNGEVMSVRKLYLRDTECICTN